MQKSNKKRADDTAKIVAVEENIALWKLCKLSSSRNSTYIYTDLNGKIIFNGQTFLYATPFSNSRACIKQNDSQWSILDLENKEFVHLPNEISWGNLNNFRNDNLILFDEKKLHWGSYQYNPKENSFTENIPFIWDTLEFSRLNGQIYAGIHSIEKIRDNHPTSHWSDDNGDLFSICIAKMFLNDSRDLKCYNYLKDEYGNIKYQDSLRTICTKIPNTYTLEERQKQVLEYISATYNLSDNYYYETYQNDYNTNNGKIVDVGKLYTYKQKSGKIID